MSLQTVTGQTITEPVTLAALKQRIKLTSTADDEQLLKLITAAREFAELISCKCLAPRQMVEYRDGFPYPTQVLQIPRPPLVSVDAVEYLDEDYQTWLTWAPSEYWVAVNNAPAILQPRRGYTYPATLGVAGCVRITFTAGGLIPVELSATVEKCIGDVVTFMYENVGAPVPTNLVTIPKIHYF